MRGDLLEAKEASLYQIHVKFDQYSWNLRQHLFCYLEFITYVILYSIHYVAICVYRFMCSYRQMFTLSLVVRMYARLCVAICFCCMFLAAHD